MPNDTASEAALAQLYPSLEGDLADLKRAAAVLEMVTETALPFQPISEAWWCTAPARSSETDVSFLMDRTRYDGLMFAMQAVVDRARSLDSKYHERWEAAHTSDPARAAV